jgi:hypothetical protein
MKREELRRRHGHKVQDTNVGGIFMTPSDHLFVLTR